MAISINGSVYTVQSTASNTTYNISSVVVPSGSNQILIVGVGNRGNGGGLNPTSAVSWNGSALTQLDTQVHTGVDQWASLWYLINPTPATANVIITVGSLPTAQSAAFAYTLQNVNQSAPFGTGYINNAAGGSLTATSSSITAGGAVIDILVDGNQASDPSGTPGAGQTKVAGLELGDPSGFVVMLGSVKSVTGATTMSWTETNNVYAVWVAYPVTEYVAPLIGSLGQFDPEMRILGWF